MLKQPITFEDFNGVTRTEDVYFNLTKAELVDWSADSEEGIQKEMQDAIATKDMRKLLDFIKQLIFKSYGERDKDGIHFHKSEEIARRFENSAMYSPLLLALFADEGNTVTNFINGLMPADLVKAAMKEAGLSSPEAEAIKEQYAPSARDIAAAAREQAAHPSFNEAPTIGIVYATVAPDVTQAAEPVQQGRLEPELQEDSVEQTRKAFRVKETPMDEDAAADLAAREAADRAAFEEWKATRPPHEQ